MRASRRFVLYKTWHDIDDSGISCQGQETVWSASRSEENPHTSNCFGADNASAFRSAIAYSLLLAVETRLQCGSKAPDVCGANSSLADSHDQLGLEELRPDVGSPIERQLAGPPW